MMKLGMTAFLAAVLAMAGLATAGVTVTTSMVGPTSVNVGDEAAWDITISVATDEDVTGVTVKDGFGADLDEIVVGTPTAGTAAAAKMGKGKMGATLVAWYVGDLVAGQSADLTVTVTTGFNPAGKHEFTEAGLAHELDGGASAAYVAGGIEYETPSTPPLTVDVLEPVE